MRACSVARSVSEGRCAVRSFSSDDSRGPRVNSVGVARATIIGNVGQDPRVVRFEEGAVATFSLATSHPVKTASGTYEPKTEWYSIVAKGSVLCDSVEKAIRQGQMVWVEGPIEHKEYTDKNGAAKKQMQIRILSAQNMKILRYPSMAGDRDADATGKAVFSNDNGQVYD